MNRWILTIPTIVLFASAVSFAQEPLPPSDSVAQPPPDDTLRVQPLASSATMASMGTAFTYQGQLRKNGVPVNATCSFQFSLFDGPGVGATQIGTTQTKSGVSVTNGLFTIPDLDFGSGAFNGEARWLAIAVQCPGDSSHTTLSPRQALTPAPYALALPGLWTQQNTTSPNLIGGYHGNQVTAGAVGATIGGGGNSGNLNRVTDNYSTVGGGAGNRAGNNTGTVTDAPFATVGGGVYNTASGDGATVGGGSGNAASGTSAMVGGGFENAAIGDYATIPGGYQAGAAHYGQLAYASGMFANPGDAQFSLYVLRNTTNSSAWTPLYLDGSSAQITISPGRTVAFEILVAARNDGIHSAGYRFQGVVENTGGGAVLLSATGVTIYEDVGIWDARVIASGSNLVVEVLGSVATTVRWVAVVRTAEVGW